MRCGAGTRVAGAAGDCCQAMSMSLRLQCLLGLSAGIARAHVPQGFPKLPINPALGVPGFPDCVRDQRAAAQGVAPEFALNCSVTEQKAGLIQIGTIGDSITAGVHSTGGNHTYPGQLQIMLDKAYPNKYQVCSDPPSCKVGSEPCRAAHVSPRHSDPLERMAR